MITMDLGTRTTIKKPSYRKGGTMKRHNWSDISGAAVDAAFCAFVVTCLGLIVFFIGSAIIELVKMFWK
jgi:hypothetical protein